MKGCEGMLEGSGANASLFPLPHKLCLLNGACITTSA